MAAAAGRALGLLLLLWIAFRVLGQGLTLASGGVVAFLHGVNLVFHEAGHLIFGFFGQFVAVLGGSLNQVLIPVICVVAFLRTHQRASAAVALFWTGQSLADVAVYAADGRAMALPLLAEGLIHDWNYILGHTCHGRWGSESFTSREISLREVCESRGRSGSASPRGCGEFAGRRDDAARKGRRPVVPFGSRPAAGATRCRAARRARRGVDDTACR